MMSLLAFLSGLILMSPLMLAIPVGLAVVLALLVTIQIFPLIFGLIAVNAIACSLALGFAIGTTRDYAKDHSEQEILAKFSIAGIGLGAALSGSAGFALVTSIAFLTVAASVTASAFTLVFPPIGIVIALGALTIAGVGILSIGAAYLNSRPAPGTHTTQQTNSQSTQNILTDLTLVNNAPQVKRCNDYHQRRRSWSSGEIAEKITGSSSTLHYRGNNTPAPTPMAVNSPLPQRTNKR